MKKIILILSILLISNTINTNASEIKSPSFLLQHINIVDIANEKVLENRDILIENNTIRAIKPSGQFGNMSTIINIDLKGKYLIPGLWDAHIHFFQSGGLYTRPDAIDLRHKVSYSENQTSIHNNISDVLRTYLSCGILNVAECGGTDWNFELSDMIDSKKILNSPNVQMTGKLITPWKPDVYDDINGPFCKVSNKKEAIKEVNRQLKLGADHIKIWYIVLKDQTPDHFFPIAKAICDETHKSGKKVWVHATELETAKYAIKAGADVLVHLPADKNVDDDFLSLAKDKDITLIPTMYVFQSYTEVLSKKVNLMPIEHLLGDPFEISTFFDLYEIDNYSKYVKNKKRIINKENKVETSEIVLYNMKKIFEAEINIVSGTDAGNIGVIHGPSLFHEFAMMKKAGLADIDILKATTINASKLIGKEYGRIKEGIKPEFIILNSNPLADIQNTSDIYMIAHNNQFVLQDSYINKTPKNIAQMQLNGYNEHNLENFLLAYADDVEIYEFPNKLLYKGKEKMRNLYADYFEKAGDKLHCTLTDRLIYKNFVFDKEEIQTNIKNRKKFTGQAIYEIEEGKIIKVWFIK